MSKFKKIEKEFLLTNSSVNTYGYRLLTAGYLMDEFKKNAIGYYMHATPEHPREQGVLVKWDDLRMDGDNVYGKPCINLSHPRGQRTVDEVESGFLNAASFGNFVVLEVSTDPADYLEGQTGPSISKWYNRECSLVDVPGNYDALRTGLFDANNNPLQLENLNSIFTKMKQVFLTAEQLGLINLKADVADAASVTLALNNLVAEAAKVPQLVQDLADMSNKKATAETALADLQAATVTKEVNDILDQALNVDKKITKEVSDQLKTAYDKKPVELKALIAAMPVFTNVVAEIKNTGTDLAALNAKSWNELDKAGLLPALKAKDFEAFKAKYKGQFGNEYTGS